MTKSLILSIALILASCAPKGKITQPPPPPIEQKPPLVFDKTFGEVTYAGKASLIIQYKDIRIAVDPVSTDAVPFDYVFLTDTRPRHFSDSARSSLKKTTKLIVPPAAASEMKQVGFTNAKGLGADQRILLQKEKAYLFSTSLQTKDPVDGTQVNSYLLEFDNGRNILIAGDAINLDVFRTFLYNLRDDGKEIHLMFVQAAESAPAAQTIALFQPFAAFVLPAGPDQRLPDKTALNSSLEAEIYNGGLVIPVADNHFPF